MFCCKCCYKKRNKNKAVVAVSAINEGKGDGNSEVEDLTMRNVGEAAIDHLE